jgi:hypothetical protein
MGAAKPRAGVKAVATMSGINSFLIFNFFSVGQRYRWATHEPCRRKTAFYNKGLQAQ